MLCQDTDRHQAANFIAIVQWHWDYINTEEGATVDWKMNITGVQLDLTSSLTGIKTI